MKIYTKLIHFVRLFAFWIIIATILACCNTIKGVEYTPIIETNYEVAKDAWLYDQFPKSPEEHLNLYYKKGQVVTVIGYLPYFAVVRSSGVKYLIDITCLGDAIYYQYDYVYGTYRTIYVGPRGGHYYYSNTGSKVYTTPASTYYNNQIFIGPRGGEYYYNSNGNKTYIKR